MIRLLPTLLLAAAGSTALGSVLAQTQDKPGQGTPQTRTMGSETETDTVLATWLLIGNQLEIEIGRIAEQRAQSDEVKRFAQTIVRDHQKIAQKLQRFAAPTNIAGGAGADEGRTREAGAPRAAASGDFDHVKLIEELGRQHLETARGELQSKQGEELDHCFVGMAIAGHMKASDMMTVFERHASGELKSTIQEGQRTVKQHLEHAKGLAKEMKGTMSKDR